MKGFNINTWEAQPSACPRLWPKMVKLVILSLAMTACQVSPTAWYGEINNQNPADGSITNVTKPVLSWDAVEAAAMYQLQISRNLSDVETTAEIIVPGPEFTPATPLGDRATHYWRVRVISQGGIPGQWSEIYSLTVNTFVHLKGNRFTMGSSDQEKDSDEIQREVIVYDFHISSYEVSHREFLIFLNSAGVSPNGFLNDHKIVDIGTNFAVNLASGNPFRFVASDAVQDIDCPVVNVTWYGAVEYANWLSRENDLQPLYEFTDGKGDEAEVNWWANGYRLPTEAEWEYAARGGLQSNGHMYSGSDEADVVAWHSGNSSGHSHETGSLSPNEAGIFDMSGNVYEWCWDWYSEVQPDTDNIDPKGPNTGTRRVIRGGSWNSPLKNLRPSDRFSAYPGETYSNIGLRLILFTGSTS